MRISVVIPALNEAEQIAETIASVPTDTDCEIIVSDGGSDDDTRRIAEETGARVIETARGRGPQMNAGAGAATGEVLLFLHADTRLPYDAFTRIRKALRNKRVAGGAFRFRTDGRGAFYAFSRIGVNLRSRLLQLPFGDQGLFVRSAVFDALDGYRDLPACEDLDLVRRMKKRGRLTLVRSSATTSSRKWETHGPLRVYWFHVRTFVRYYRGRL